jgi:N-acetylmuramoyl-L-alanine amidase
MKSVFVQPVANPSYSRRASLCGNIVTISIFELSLILANCAAFTAWSQDVHDAPTNSCDRSQYRVILDVGHSVEAPGAMSARNVPEYEFNLRLAEQIERCLIKEGFTRTVLLITHGVGRPTLFKRVDAANSLSANLLLSIHHDSVPDSFLEDWEFDGKPSHFNDRFGGYLLFISHDNPNFEASLLFAKLLGEQLKAQGLQYARQYTEAFMGQYRRELADADAGVYRYDQLLVLKEARMPAALLEAGSIINRDEELQMNSPERRDLISTSVAAAVESFCEARSGQ